MKDLQLDFNGSEMEWEDLGGGLSRQIMGYDKRIMMVKVKFEKGGVGALHSHPHSQVTYCASGRFEFTIEGEKKIVSSGDGLYIPPDAEHGAVCLEAGVVVDVFSPHREDFLNL